MPPPPPPPPDLIKSYGVLDENGTMSDEFEIGEFDPDVMENWGNDTKIHEEKSEDSRFKFKTMKFREMLTLNIRRQKPRPPILSFGVGEFLGK
ncbi:hypothetical protein SLA2020_045800 [Shorea laevis]